MTTNEVNPTLIGIEHQSVFTMNWAFLAHHLSKGLYDDPLTAFREYIQNERDADASRITIDISKDKIRMAGDGHGIKIFKDFKELGSPNKQSNSKNIGGKGMGKLSYKQLASKITINSSSENGILMDTGELIKHIQLKIDFDSNDVQIKWKKINLPYSHGTELIINDPIVVIKQNKLREYLSNQLAPKLRPPTTIQISVNNKLIKPPSLTSDYSYVSLNCKSGLVSGFIQTKFNGDLITKGVKIYVKGMYVKTYYLTSGVTPSGELNADFLETSTDRNDIINNEDYKDFENKLKIFVKGLNIKELEIDSRLRQALSSCGHQLERTFSELDYKFPTTAELLDVGALKMESSQKALNEYVIGNSNRKEGLSRGKGFKDNGISEDGIIAPYSPFKVFIDSENENRTRRSGNSLFIHVQEIQKDEEQYVYDKSTGTLTLSKSLLQSIVEGGGRYYKEQAALMIVFMTALAIGESEGKNWGLMNKIIMTYLSKNR